MSTSAAALPGGVDAARDPAALRRAFGSFGTGVTVVTVGGASPRGMTANSFVSVSLTPPLVLLCVGRDAVMHGCLESAATFGVSVLGADQEKVARHFASRSRPMGAEQFRSVDVTSGRVVDAPLIAGAPAHFECRKWNAYDGGDHVIYVGEVLALAEGRETDALLFHRGRFRHLAPEPEAEAP